MLEENKIGGFPMYKWLSGLLGSKHKGEIDVSGLMMMGIAMIFLAVGFIIYPIIMTATDSILTWTAATTLTHLPGFAAGPPIVPADIDIFTGLAQVAGIVPLIVLIGFVAAGALSGFMGFKMIKGEKSSESGDMGGILMLGIGLIFIAVGLIIFPVIMDGVSVALDAALTGTAYTGLSNVLGVVPLIVLIAFVAGGIVAGFFGVKKMGARA